MRLLISACLMGIRCRYDGKSKPIACVEELNKRYTLIPVCPEVWGGLETPRVPAERIGARVLTEDGRDVTAAYALGAQRVLDIARSGGCELALLKERSPSCGLGSIYDGTFTGKLCEGKGVCAQLLTENGIRVIGESRVDELLK